MDPSDLYLSSSIPASIQTLVEQKQAILAAIVTTSDDAIISKTLQGIITSWNPAAGRMFGYTEAEAIGQHITLIIPPDRLTEEEFIISEIAKGNRISHFETIRVNKGGHDVAISVSISPIIDNNGTIIGASKIARDISDQKNAIQKQATLAAIVDTSDDTILSKTLEGIITSWNKSAEKMFGYTEAEAVGQHISLIIPTERLDEELYIISEVKQGNKIDHFHTMRQAKDGRLVPISLTVSPIMDNHGTVIGASKIARDISAQQAAEAENARLFAEIKSLNEKKDEFIGLASHELKTPLTSINGYLQIISGLITNEKALQFLQKTRQQVKKLNTLVSDLLDVSKIEAGKLQIADEPFDICQVLNDAIELIGHGNKNHVITLNTPVDNLTVIGDAHRIEQVIINLLTNAIRYSPGANKIEVGLTREANEARVWVKDHGMGIPVDKQPHIFTRFYRVNDDNPTVSGLGIGLYLSKEIVLQHSGRIWVESEPGKGSTFLFSLPMHPAQ